MPERVASAAQQAASGGAGYLLRAAYRPRPIAPLGISTARPGPARPGAPRTALAREGMREWQAAWHSEPMPQDLRTLAISAVVAAVVALAFEAIFKPSLAVRTDRRLARDQARRESAEALWAVASRAEVVAKLGLLPVYSGLALLNAELHRLSEEVEAGRAVLVQSWQSSPPEIPELATSGLARPTAVVAGLVPRLATTSEGTFDGLVEGVKEDLFRGNQELVVAADFWQRLLDVFCVGPGS